MDNKSFAECPQCKSKNISAFFDEPVEEVKEEVDNEDDD